MKDSTSKMLKWIFVTFIVLIVSIYAFNMIMYITTPKVIKQPVTRIYKTVQSSDKSDFYSFQALREMREKKMNGLPGAVKSYLMTNLNDPDSLRIVEFSQPYENKDGSWSIRCMYRAKNQLGGYVKKNQVFNFDQEASSVATVENY